MSKTVTFALQHAACACDCLSMSGPQSNVPPDALDLFVSMTHFPNQHPCSLPQVFLTHLHSDHHADLASLYVGAMFGRKTAWEVWGPSSEKPEYGLAASIEGLRQVRDAPSTHAD